MIKRHLLDQLAQWAVKPNRKPLVLRGARQVGKTTAVDLFAQTFDVYIRLNLETPRDKNLFTHHLPFNELLESIFLAKGKSRQGRVLIFIDEIQYSPEAMQMLRYFYEQSPDLYVIAAGSLLETSVNFQQSFPVGRVEYLYVQPLSFSEYLLAMGQTQALDVFHEIPCPTYAHEHLLQHFYKYTLIGGMPEIVATYSETQSIATLNDLYEGLLRAYLDDVNKYAKNTTMANILRFAIEQAFTHAGERIKFHGFGHSHYGSREMGEALRTLEQAMLIHLMYPTTVLRPPIQMDHKKSPRLHVLDTGLVNYFSGLQQQYFGANKLDHIYEGKIAELIVGQLLFTVFTRLNEPVTFWVREAQANAQVDYLVPYQESLLPIEVKAAPVGRLRSLHEFIDRTSSEYAIRLYSGPFMINELTTISQGKKFKLINLPIYLTEKIPDYMALVY